jgi:hypothetical protein
MTSKEKYLSHILGQLANFLQTDWPRNQWIENTAIKVYVRQSERYLSSFCERSLTCLDIANIAVAERYRQQGLFTDFVLQAHELHPFEITYLECIRNPIILHWCEKRGWTPHNPCDKKQVDCFYLLKQVEPASFKGEREYC